MALNIKITTDVDTDKILQLKGLRANGRVDLNKELTNKIAKYANNYVPFKKGRLKDVMVSMDRTHIYYNAPYARKQYYTNRGLGKQGASAGGKRGKMWITRSWTDCGNKIIEELKGMMR